MLGVPDIVALLPALLFWLLTVRSGITLNLFESGTLLAGGQHLIHGHMLYVDVFAFYGPIAYLEPYAVARIFGRSDLALVLPDLILGAVSCWIAYRLTLHLSGRRWISLIAPVAIAAEGADTARTLPALISLLALAHYERTGARWWLFLSGIWGGVAMLWFQDAGVWLAISVLVVAAVCVGRSTADFARKLRSVLGWPLGLLTVMLPAALAVALAGAFSKWLYYCFVFPNTTYERRSATGYLHSLIASWSGLSLPRLIYKYAFYVVPYPLVALVAAACAALTLYGLARRPRITSIPLTAAALAVYALLQLRLVFASIDESKLADASAPTIVAAIGLTAWMARRTNEWASPRVEGAARIGFALASACLVLIAIQKQVHGRIHVAATPTETDGGILSGIPLAGASPPTTSIHDLAALTDYIKGHTTSHQTIFVAPTQPLIYYLTGRDNATGYDYLDPVYTTPSVDSRIVTQLEAARPSLVVLADNKFPTVKRTYSGPELAPLTYAWIAMHYRSVARIGKFSLLSARM